MKVKIPKDDVAFVKDALSRFYWESRRYRRDQADAVARVLAQMGG